MVRNRLVMLTLLGLAGLLGLDGQVQARGFGEGGTTLPELTGRPAPSPGGLGGPRTGAEDPGSTPTLRRGREGMPRPRRLRGGGLRYTFPGWEADLEPDGAVVFRDRRVSYRARRAEVAFEAGGGASRRRGGDPYALEKLRFLEETRDFRSTLRAQARARWQRAYFAELPGRLTRLWARRDLTPARKRHLIFELWRECLEPAASDLQFAAGRARAVILAFVRTHLPAGSPHAYTPVELTRMGRPEKGREPFVPYLRVTAPR